MGDISFEWDDRKACDNLEKHGVSFEEAATAFLGDHARLMHDPDHSADEDRFVLLGFSSWLRLLVICHCYHKDEKVIRIISARRATRQEQKQYGSF